MDLTGAEDARDRIARELGREVLAISAVTGQGIPALLHAIHERLEEQRRIEPPPAALPDVGDRGADSRAGHGRLSDAAHRGRPGKLPAQVGAAR